MGWLERVIKRLFSAVGLAIAKSRRVAHPTLPRPSPEVIETAARSFKDSFTLAPESNLSPAQVEQQLKNYLWFYPFEFGGIRVEHDAEKAQAPHYRQNAHKQRHAHIFPALLSMTGGSLAGHTVLDVACNAGFWSLQARLAGAERVVGVDASAKNVEQAQLVAQLTGLGGLDYRVLNIYDLSKEAVGEFDITFFFGILYHLDKPMLAFERVCEVTRKFVVVDTRLVDLDIPVLRAEADSAPSYHSQSHTNSLALIPSPGAVPLMLKSAGFREVYRVQHASRNLPQQYLMGTWGTFVAVK